MLLLIICAIFAHLTLSAFADVCFGPAYGCYPSIAALSPHQLLVSIEQAWQAGQGSYTVPPGTYNFSSTTGFTLTGAPGLLPFTLSCYGSVFLFAPGYGITLANTTGVSLQGVTVDYYPTFFTQGVVSDMKRLAGNYLRYTLTLDEGYPSMDDRVFPIFNYSAVPAKTIFWSPDTRSIYHWQVQTTSTVHNATKVGTTPSGQGQYSIYTFLNPLLSEYTPGDGSLGTISPVVVPAFHCSHCANMTFTDVTLYGSSGMGYIEVGGYGNSTLLRWRNVRKDNTTRLLSTSLDGIHSTSVQHGLLLQDSEISYAGDDLFAVHCELGIAWGVPTGSGRGMGGVMADQSLYVIDTGGIEGYTVAQAQPGDTLYFYALNETMDPLASAVVASITVVANETLQQEAAAVAAQIKRTKNMTIRPISSTLLMQISFTQPLPTVLLPQLSAMVQLNTRCGYGTRVINTSLHDTTGGMRLKSVNVTVHNSTIARAYGMRMFPEPFWTQSISSNVTISSCTFADTGNAPAAPESIMYNNDTCTGLTLLNNTFQ